MKKVILALGLFAVSYAANAVSVALVTHNQTSGSGTISTLITDGSWVGTSGTNSAAGPTTAVWDWDGTVLHATGLYTATGSIGSSPFGSSILTDTITDLWIDTSFSSGGSATAYACVEGTFLGTVGASGCGGHNFGADMMNNSTTVWGPGLAVSRTIGGDDYSTGGLPRSISAYDFKLLSWDGVTLKIGNGIAVGSQGTAGTGGGEVMTFTAVPVPAAVWLFGSALGLLGWVRRRVAQ